MFFHVCTYVSSCISWSSLRDPLSLNTLYYFERDGKFSIAAWRGRNRRWENKSLNATGSPVFSILYPAIGIIIFDLLCLLPPSTAWIVFLLSEPEHHITPLYTTTIFKNISKPNLIFFLRVFTFLIRQGEKNKRERGVQVKIYHKLVFFFLWIFMIFTGFCPGFCHLEMLGITIKITQKTPSHFFERNCFAFSHRRRKKY